NRRRRWSRCASQRPNSRGKFWIKRRASMAENYYHDLREFIDVLEKEGLLYRWRRSVNKDSELMPLMRLQYRGRSDAERQAFLDGKGNGWRGPSLGSQGSPGSLGSFAQNCRFGHGMRRPRRNV